MIKLTNLFTLNRKKRRRRKKKDSLGYEKGKRKKCKNWQVFDLKVSD